MRRGLGYEKINILVYPDDYACERSDQDSYR